MLEMLQRFLNPQGFVAHGHCYLWQPELVWLHVIGDGAIAVAYFSIPLTLVYFVSQRKDIPFNWIFWMFGGFIIACGIGHIMAIWTIWQPTYWLSGTLKAITALISVITAVELIPLVPKVLALPSPAQLEAANRELEKALSQLQQAQAQLIQTEKMSGLGQLVAGIAHEINNPVSFIHGNLAHTTASTHALLRLLQTYQEAYPQPTLAVQQAIATTDLEFLKDDLPKMLLSMKTGTDRIRQLVLSLRTFARLDEAEKKHVNIHEGIDSALMLLQSHLEPTPDRPAIEVVKVYGILPLVECYAGPLNQVLLNLLRNAIDTLEAATKFSQAEPPLVPTIRIQTTLQEDHWLLIDITDNGSGIPEPIRPHIFNPFFTTKAVGKGPGLGLAISYQIIVEKHGGQIQYHSTVEQGTTFQIKIPIRSQLSGH